MLPFSYLRPIASILHHHRLKMTLQPIIKLFIALSPHGHRYGGSSPYPHPYSLPSTPGFPPLFFVPFPPLFLPSRSNQLFPFSTDNFECFLHPLLPSPALPPVVVPPSFSTSTTPREITQLPPASFPHPPPLSPPPHPSPPPNLSSVLSLPGPRRHVLFG